MCSQSDAAHRPKRVVPVSASSWVSAISTSAITWSSNFAEPGVQWMWSGSPSCSVNAGAISISASSALIQSDRVVGAGDGERPDPGREFANPFLQPPHRGSGSGRGAAEVVLFEKRSWVEADIERVGVLDGIDEIDNRIERLADLGVVARCHVHDRSVPISDVVRY